MEKHLSLLSSYILEFLKFELGDTVIAVSADNTNNEFWR